MNGGIKEKVKLQAYPLISVKRRVVTQIRAFLFVTSCLTFKGPGRCRSSLMPIHLSTLTQIKALDLYATPSAHAHVRVRWVEEGETSSSFIWSRSWTLNVRSRHWKQITALWFLVLTACVKFFGIFSVISLRLCHVIQLFVISFRLKYLLLYLLINVLLVRAFSARRNVGEHFTQWCMGKVLALMEFDVKFWLVLGGDLVDVPNSCFEFRSASQS